MADILRSINDYQKAFDYYTSSNHAYELLSDAVQLGYNHFYQAVCLLNLGDKPRASELYIKASDYFMSLGKLCMQLHYLKNAFKHTVIGL